MTINVEGLFKSASLTVSAHETAAMVQSRREHALLDVREYAEASLGRIEASTILPRRMLESRTTLVIPRRDTPVIVYDGGDGRAQLSVATLRSLGYERVASLEGGIAAWEAMGYPVAQGLNVVSKRFGEWLLDDDQVPEVRSDTLEEWSRTEGWLKLVDVRPQAEYLSGTVPGAENVPGIDVLLHSERWRRQGTRVVTHCAGRTRGILAAATLRLQGVNAQVLQDGTQGWILSGRSLDYRPRQVGDGWALGVDSEPGQLPQAVRDAARPVSGYELTKLVKSDRTTYVIDVRSGAEYSTLHIPASIHVPGGQLVSALDDHIGVAWSTIVLVDEGLGSGRAQWTGYWLRRLGVPNVLVLDGGVTRHREEGRPTEEGRQRNRPFAGLDGGRQLLLLDSADLSVLAGDVTIVDVDTSDQFAAGHIPEAHWILRSWLERDISTVAPSLDSPIVCYCHHDGRQSVLAAATLIEMGYTNVSVLRGGMRAWTDASLQVQQSVLGGPPVDVVRLPHEDGTAAMHDYLSSQRKLNLREGAREGQTAWSLARAFSRADPAGRGAHT